MVQRLGVIDRAGTRIEVRGAPGTHPRLVELRLPDGRVLGVIGVCGAETPARWSSHPDGAWYDPVRLGDLVSDVLS